MSKTLTVICLLRNDLRIHDNEVLYWANKYADYVLPVYCFDPRHFQGTHHFNFPKTGPHRLRFLLESITDLRKNLQSCGSGLVVKQGEPEVVIPDLIQKLGKDTVHALAYQTEATKEELDVEETLKAKCGVKIQTFWGHTLFHRDDLPFGVGQLPDVYTQFRKQVEGECVVRDKIDMPRTFKPLPPGIVLGEIPNAEALGVKEAVPDPRSVFPWSGGETSALMRLNQYLWNTDRVATYKETKNGMIGADYSTKFSAWYKQ